MNFLKPHIRANRSPAAELRFGEWGCTEAWVPDRVKAYLYDLSQRGARAPLFSSLLLSPCASSYGRALDPLYSGLTAPSDIRDWLDWLFELYLPPSGLHAIEQAIEEADRVVDVWVTLPYPEPTQADFGAIRGHSMNFRYMQDRYRALEWWMQLFLAKWRRSKGLARLRLRGFRWPREVLTEEDERLIRELSAMVKRRRLQWMWVTHYGAAKVETWRELGFNAVVLDPNYYGRTDIPREYVDYASAYASVMGCGLLVPCGKGYVYDRSHFREYMLRGLPTRAGFWEKAFTLFAFRGWTLPEIARARPELYRSVAYTVRRLCK